MFEGMIVKSIRGHDIGEHFVVVKLQGNFVYISDGKSRKLTKPKLKNKKHLAIASTQLIDLKTQTDKSVRRLVNLMNNEAKKP